MGTLRVRSIPANISYIWGIVFHHERQITSFKNVNNNFWTFCVLSIEYEISFNWLHKLWDFRTTKLSDFDSIFRFNCICYWKGSGTVYSDCRLWDMISVLIIEMIKLLQINYFWSINYNSVSDSGWMWNYFFLRCRPNNYLFGSISFF